MADDIKDVGESNSKLDFDGDDVVDLCCSVALAWIAGCAAAVHVGLLCGTTFSVAHALANDLLIVARSSRNSSSRTAILSEVFERRLWSFQGGRSGFCVAFQSIEKGTPRALPALALAFCQTASGYVASWLVLCASDRDTT